jgi:hypothetical protein
MILEDPIDVMADEYGKDEVYFFNKEVHAFSDMFRPEK